jgi:two-component system response regulator DesR
MIRVLPAEDMRILREALAGLLRLEADLDVVAEVEHGDAIVPAALEHRPDVLRLTAHGATPREVAGQLHLACGTVRNYLASAVTKLHARNSVDAIRIATEAGWL